MRALPLLCTVACLMASCGGSTVSTVVAGEVRQKTVPVDPNLSQTCDGTHTIACSQGGCCSPAETCVIALRPVIAGIGYCSSCPADFPAACSRTNCCKSAGACITNGNYSIIGTCGCPTGQTACGDACCPAGASCVSGVCRSCPDSAPTLCGTECRSGACDSGPGGCSPSTGCGNGWLSSCDNRCYATSGDCQAAGPPQGCNSGSCRQCP